MEVGAGDITKALIELLEARQKIAKSLADYNAEVDEFNAGFQAYKEGFCLMMNQMN